ncbi:hypothetical protein [Paraburkholderia sp. BCC1876]|uniref:hypothetical protein n=1 Tax=Paraburkholderia sp. BCC1876 TaxID=2676303 RepID=UPI001591515B|nr:hypothetical protein [Paraburkholderia sp. BCC1876]
MSKSEYLTDHATFDRLRRQADEGKRLVADAVRDGTALYFDSSDICTFQYHAFLRSLVAKTGETAFAALVLRPAPEEYFYHHFAKYSALIFLPEHSDQDFVASLNADPGGSLADAFDANSERYAIFPLSGKWAIYADRQQELAAMAGPRDVLAFTRLHYPFAVLEESPGFAIVD